MSKWDEERIAELMKKRVKMGQTPPAPRPSLAAQELTDAWSEARAIDLTKNRDAASMVRVGDLMASALRQQPPPTPASGETPRTDALLHERRMAERQSDVWDVEDVEAFLKHARQLERELHEAGDGDTWRAAYHRTERELRKLEMAMPDYKQCCELREKAERELAEAQSATPASEETGTVVCTVEFVQAAKEMAEAVRWVIQDAAYKPPEEIGYIPQRWIDRLRGVERVADEKLNASTDESSKSG